MVVAFLFFWMIGLLTELQRAEGLALDKFLHLPVSPAGAFLINYLSSLFSLTLIVFVPAMIGLIARAGRSPMGPAMLLALPLLAAFVLAVTAVTYQFQGWLASLMTNPRRRRTVIVVRDGRVHPPRPAAEPDQRGPPVGRRRSTSNRQLQEQRNALHLEHVAKKMTPEEFRSATRSFRQEHDEQGRGESNRRRLAELGAHGPR